MTTQRTAPAREKIIKAGIERIRVHGYAATTVDEICADAGVTKGAFFHHFSTKEDLADACLQAWAARSVAFDETAPYRQLLDPGARLWAALEFYAGVFSSTKLVNSCLVGTMVQEVSDSHQHLRGVAQGCFQQMEERFAGLIAEAAAHTQKSVDAAALARLWMAGIQGSLVLFKASQDPAMIRANLLHLRDYICGCAGVRPNTVGES